MPEDKKNQISLTKFIANLEPFYSNKQDKKHTTWLKSVDRLCKAVNMSDKDVLVVATSYLHGPAKIWWDSIEDRTYIWKEFTDTFMNRFASYNVVYKLRELFSSVKVNSESFKVHSLLQAIDPQIAYELEQRDDLPVDFETVAEKAQKLELVKAKYHNDLVERSSIGSESGCSTISKASTLRDLVKEFGALKVHVIEQPKSKSVSLPSTNKPRGKCWACGSEDHISPQCPQQPKHNNDQRKGNGQQ
ncbi:CCHC-type zinc finger transcription factor [Phycomyces blakesleeanus]|uniref:CCHC-type zinc finger transcription factor n=2 Tax=Phycomyces blakesleeanus TaxID=4837 RepID=A0A162TAR9_PHYB8|nr:CCHC-type zinc finger transcription factor [Phycomyces blakesleeanus NRRL 1555(-)]OAD67252.1 CCHC-type zinc finger transcription factor [Phycomyces blakesleeanus NRRL 1555(-)]|eukprot:XP_018285292.1 CCHC-type zinc finger transcription factor [Phycomyces blakesleeanus NRRL 1555(-)]